MPQNMAPQSSGPNIISPAISWVTLLLTTRSLESATLPREAWHGTGHTQSFISAVGCMVQWSPLGETYGKDNF